MGNKLKDEVIVKLFEDKGYKIIGEITNTITPTFCEKNGYWYKISYNNLRYGKKPSLWGFSNLINLDHNIQNLIETKREKVQYIRYSIVQKSKRKRVKVDFICECGNNFSKLLEDAVYGTYLCCNECSKKRRGKTSRVAQKTINIVKEAGYKILSCPELPRITDLIEVEDSLGFKGFVTSNKIRGHKGMSRFDIRINKKHYIENVNHYAKLNGIECHCIALVEEKKYRRQALEFECVCGNHFITSIDSFQNGKIRCESCAKSISRYEFSFKEYLESMNIEYVYQYSLNQCRDILPLPFDFYLKEYKCLIEIDGEGHYHLCNFNRISNEQAQITFDITQKHDKIKTQFCLENNIPLLRISYQEFKQNTYKNIFQKFIEELTSLN